jgi:PAS domain-containing protein
LNAACLESLTDDIETATGHGSHMDAEAGIYTWCLDNDTFYGDTAVASLFGLDPVATITGLPVAEYIARVHPDDQALVARTISDAVIDGLPYQAEYRVVDAAGVVRQVISFGRCFRDKIGFPAHYAGIVHPVDNLVA